MYNLTLLFIVCLQQVLGQSKLGLIVKNRELQLYKGERIRQVEILIPVLKPYTEYEPQVNKTIDLYKKIKALPALIESSPQYKEIGHILERTNQNIKVMEVNLMAISRYRDNNNNKKPSTTCTVQWISYDPKMIGSLVKELELITQDLKTESTSTTLATNAAEYKELIVIIERVANAVEVTSKQILDRTNLLENLSNKQLDPEILTGLQARGCITTAELENSKVLICETTTSGLLCSIEVKILDDKYTAQTYSLVNYQGIQIDLNGSNYLVRTDSKWKTLYCVGDFDNTLDSYDKCVLQDLSEQCSNALTEQKIGPYIQHCKFVKRIPKLTEIVEEGILVQGLDLEIELLDNIMDHKPERLYQKPPVLISTNKLVRVRQGEHEETTYPLKTVSTNQIITSWLTSDDILELEKQVNSSINLDLEDYLEITGGAFLLLLSVVVGVMFKRHKQMSEKIGPAPQEMLLRKSKAKKNLKENKRAQYI
jgi:hypothetical protein